MSRYKMFDPSDCYVVVGWDNPLQTFFVQQYVNLDAYNEDVTKAWLGCTPSEIPTIERLEEVMTQLGCSLPVDIRNGLEKDYANRTEPTPLQKMMQSLLGDIDEEG